MSYVMVVAPCYACGRLFASNPTSVPSMNNQPICRPCIELVNRRRKADGRPLWPIASDAYEAAVEDTLE